MGIDVYQLLDWDLGEVAAVDCETTGLDSREDRIIKVAVIIADLSAPAAEAKTFEATVNPGTPIPADATRVHSITDEDVAHLGDFGEIAEQLTDFVGDRDLLGFNVQFDKAFLNAELKRHGFKTFHRKSAHCVQQWLQDAWRYKPSLANAAGRMQLPDFDAARHDPLQDALATVRLARMLKLQRAEVWKATGDRWTANPAASKPPTEGQLKYIRSLGGSTGKVKTRQEASWKIDRMKGNRHPDDDTPEGCITVKVLVATAAALILATMARR